MLRGQVVLEIWNSRSVTMMVTLRSLERYEPVLTSSPEGLLSREPSPPLANEWVWEEDSMPAHPQRGLVRPMARRLYRVEPSR